MRVSEVIYPGVIGRNTLETLKNQSSWFLTAFSGWAMDMFFIYAT